ncbi:AAA family ATPase, partial [Bacteroides salyersiae]
NNDASSISSKISYIIEDRFLSSKARVLNGKMYIYLFFNYPPNNPNFQELSKGIFIGKSESIDSYIETSSFYTTSGCAISSNVEIEGLVNTVFIFYSLNEINKSEIFPSTKDNAPVQYVAVEPKYSFEDVIINDDESRAIQRALTVIRDKKLIFNIWGYNKIDPATKSILCFHGAPGTGKTMCAHAVARLLGKRILIASYSQIQSKYTGEGEKNMRSYFQAAEEQDAVLFIDEADTFLSKRLPSSNANSKIYNSMSNELYQLIEEYNGCIIFASNHITDFDPAVISRIIEPIEFKIPDKEARIKIINKLLPSCIPLSKPLSEDDFDHLAEISEGFSGRDIRKSVLVFMADKVYVDKYVNQIPESLILFTLEDITQGFKEVEKAKKKLNASINNANNSLNDFVKKEETKLRLLHIAALALWSDNTVTDFEKSVFKELCDEYQLKVNINEREKLMTLDMLCKYANTKSEKCEMLDMACRMVSIDGILEPSEIEFVKNVAIHLGFKSDFFKELESYLHVLVSSYNQHKAFPEYLGTSEYDILNELCKEYTEPAALFHMAELLKNGSEYYGIIADEVKGEEYYEKARKAGYHC